MGRDPRNHVLPGDRLRIAASQVNALNDLIRVEATLDGTAWNAPASAANIVYIRNDSGGDVPAFGVLGISGVAVNPNDGARHLAEFMMRPVLTGQRPSAISHKDRFVVLLEPLASGKIGRAACGGVFPCRVFMGWGDYAFATVAHDSVDYLQAAACGPVQILWSQGGSGSTAWAVGAM